MRHVASRRAPSVQSRLIQRPLQSRQAAKMILEVVEQQSKNFPDDERERLAGEERLRKHASSCDDAKPAFSWTSYDHAKTEQMALEA